MKKLKTLDGACAVLALCYVSKQNEEALIRICTLNGFAPERGMEDNEWLPAAKMVGISLRKVSKPPRTIKTFLKKYPKGCFLMRTHNHLFVIDHGIVVDPRMDTPGLRRKVENAWRVL